MPPKIHQDGKSKKEDKEGNKNGKAGEKPKAFTIKYKRPRGSRACSVCRSRKVRCDAEIHIPCTNCITFGCVCVLPEAKKRGSSGGDTKSKRKQVVSVSSGEKENKGREENDVKQEEETSGDMGRTSEPILNISHVNVPPSLTSNYKTRPSMHKRELLNNKGRAALTFLGSSSVGMVAQKAGENHLQLAEDVFEMSDNSLDSVELEILKMRGAFLLPPKELSLDLINSYFEHIHPLMPVINRTEFVRKFEDPNDNPSLMLLQAVLLCGCRISKNPLLLDSKGSTDLASLTFFRRAKALYETNYESDPTSIIQTLILIGSYWEGPEDVTKNSFYWTRVAVGLAQGFGFHRDVTSSSNLTSSEKKIWRRIWWCLFEKDRNVAIAFGRPSVIDLNDCDVPMLTLDDFNEDDEELGIKSNCPVDETQALYFIHLVKLAEITGIIIKNQYTVKSELMKGKSKFSVIQHCDMLMGIWFTNLPPQLVFSLTDTSAQNFYACLLNAQYYNRLYLIHRSNLIKMAKSNSTNPNNYKYPSWGISFQAARMISIVSKILLDKDQIRYCPVMFVYILFSALMMLIYHVDSANTVIASTASDSLFVSRAVFKELASYWPIAGVLLRLFDKYANDKIKRARLIENGTKNAELQEKSATKRAMNDHNSLSEFYNNKMKKNNDINFSLNQVNGVSPANSQISGISPGGGVYENTNQDGPEASSGFVTKQPNIEQLVEQFKQPKMRDSASEKKSDTTPNSTHSFPDISLVTETLPTNNNFFENFEPAQLFPDINASFPPSRSHTPVVNEQDKEKQTLIGSNIYNNGNKNNLDINNVGLNTNFVDSSFINMNLQSGIDSNFMGDDLASLFNIQY